MWREGKLKKESGKDGGGGGAEDQVKSFCFEYAKSHITSKFDFQTDEGGGGTSQPQQQNGGAGGAATAATAATAAATTSKELNKNGSSSAGVVVEVKRETMAAPSSAGVKPQQVS